MLMSVVDQVSDDGLVTKVHTIVRADGHPGVFEMDLVKGLVVVNERPVRTVMCLL